VCDLCGAGGVTEAPQPAAHNTPECLTASVGRQGALWVNDRKMKNGGHCKKDENSVFSA